MRQILGTVEALPLGALASMRRHFTDSQGTDIRAVVAPMGALLSGTTDHSIAIRPLHASFPDFLTDRDRSGEFFVELTPQIVSDLAFASLGVMKDELRFNICQLPSSYLPNSKITDLDDRIRKYIPPELAYSCRFWIGHLRRAPFDLRLTEEVRALLKDERLLFWFEVLGLLKVLNTCANLLSLLIHWIMVRAITLR